MPTIRLKEGDFGSDIEVTVGLGGIYVPDPMRPGARLSIDFENIAAIDSVADDRSGQFEAAFDLAFEGLRKAGPLGLINGVQAVSKLKDIIFRVRLKDGRSFLAVADAKIYADVRSDWVSARGVLDVDDGGEESTDADAIIARYVKAGAVSAVPAAPGTSQPLQSRRAPQPPPEAPAPPPPQIPEVERRAIPDRRAQPAFGRRRPPGT